MPIPNQVMPVYTLRFFFKMHFNIILTPTTYLQVTSSSSLPTNYRTPPFLKTLSLFSHFNMEGDVSKTEKTTEIEFCLLRHVGVELGLPH